MQFGNIMFYVQQAIADVAGLIGEQNILINFNKFRKLRMIKCRKENLSKCI